MGQAVNATCAGAAMIGGDGVIWFEFNAKQDFCEQKIGASFGVDKHGILADPTQVLRVEPGHVRGWDQYRCSNDLGCDAQPVLR